MREIKYRQFLGGKFYYWGFIGGAFVGPTSGNDGNALTTPHDQFTGLKDKNGVEIYESDIVISTNISASGKLLAYNPREVVWLEGTCEFNVSSPINDWELEVIGNRFEHPTLIEIAEADSE